MLIFRSERSEGQRDRPIVKRLFIAPFLSIFAASALAALLSAVPLEARRGAFSDSSVSTPRSNAQEGSRSGGNDSPPILNHGELSISDLIFAEAINSIADERPSVQAITEFENQQGDEVEDLVERFRNLGLRPEQWWIDSEEFLQSGALSEFIEMIRQPLRGGRAELGLFLSPVQFGAGIPVIMNAWTGPKASVIDGRIDSYLSSLSGRTVIFVGHVNESRFEYLNEKGGLVKISIRNLLERARQHDVTVIPIGCNTDKAGVPLGTMSEVSPDEVAAFLRAIPSEMPLRVIDVLRAAEVFGNMHINFDAASQSYGVKAKSDNKIDSRPVTVFALSTLGPKPEEQPEESYLLNYVAIVSAVVGFPSLGSLCYALAHRPWVRRRRWRLAIRPALVVVGWVCLAASVLIIWVISGLILVPLIIGLAPDNGGIAVPLLSFGVFFITIFIFQLTIAGVTAWTEYLRGE